VLSPLNGGAPVASGSLTLPCAISSASNGVNTFVYAVDSTNSNVQGYTVGTATATAGFLTPIAGSPFPSGNQPSAIVTDPKYPFAYVTNALDGTVNGYSIGSSGALTSIATYTAGLQPVAIGIDPSTSHFLFTVNFLGNDVSDFVLNTTDGTLIDTQHSPYGASAEPTAVAAIPHGVSQK
jgi:6-phosphogluconolactonase (cycloisomerase 2 family)